MLFGKKIINGTKAVTGQNNLIKITLLPKSIIHQLLVITAMMLSITVFKSVYNF